MPTDFRTNGAWLAGTAGAYVPPDFRTNGAWLASTGQRPVFWDIQESTLQAYG
jgi:hypothetical protein